MTAYIDIVYELHVNSMVHAVMYTYIQPLPMILGQLTFFERGLLLGRRPAPPRVAHDAYDPCTVFGHLGLTGRRCSLHSWGRLYRLEALKCREISKSLSDLINLLNDEIFSVGNRDELAPPASLLDSYRLRISTPTNLSLFPT